MKQDPIAMNLWNRSQKQLNREQIESVEKSTTSKRFQLIQGPPGQLNSYITSIIVCVHKIEKSILSLSHNINR